MEEIGCNSSKNLCQLMKYSAHINQALYECDKVLSRSHIIASDCTYVPIIRGHRNKIYADVFDTFGQTPLVRLNKIPKEEGVVCDMYAKCEFMNPGGSVKDRTAYRMVLDAEHQGRLKPGVSVLVEPTSGNTGISLALAGVCRGYRVIVVMSEKNSMDKVHTMQLMGAEIVMTPAEAQSDGPDGPIGVARRLTQEIPAAVMLDQYSNTSNPLAHYDTTGEELLWSLDNSVDMVVMGTGTGGTLSGSACKIKERCPNCIVVGVDPYGSLFAPPAKIGNYLVEGIGGDHIPETLDYDPIDKWVKVDDCNSFSMARRLVKEEGMLCGGSSGAALWAAIQSAKSLKAGQRCVVLLPDTIRNYMNGYIIDQWMEAHLFKSIPSQNLWWWDLKLCKSMLVLLLASTPFLEAESTSVCHALCLVVNEAAPCGVIVDHHGSLKGVFTVDFARKRLANDHANIQDSLDKFTQTDFYSVNLSDPPTLGYISRVLDIAPFVVLVKTGASDIKRPLGAITSDSLMKYVSNKKQ